MGQAERSQRFVAIGRALSIDRLRIRQPNRRERILTQAGLAVIKPQSLTFRSAGFLPARRLRESIDQFLQ